MDWDGQAFLYTGIDQSLDMGHPRKAHASPHWRQSLKQLTAFPEVRVTNPSPKTDVGSI